MVDVHDLRNINAAIEERLAVIGRITGTVRPLEDGVTATELRAVIGRMSTILDELEALRADNARLTRERDEAQAAGAVWRTHTQRLVQAMKTWGSWEDGVPAASDGGECGGVGRAFEDARGALIPAENLAAWRCSSCGKSPCWPDSAWRWNGAAWQHTHADAPQAGHFDAGYADPSRALLDRLEKAERERDDLQRALQVQTSRGTQALEAECARAAKAEADLHRERERADKACGLLAECREYLPSDEDHGYGYYYGGDPRDFHPDPECCTPEEVEAHRVACDAAEKGEPIVAEAHRHVPITDGDGKPAGWLSFSGSFGIGSYTMRDPDLARLRAAIDTILGKDPTHEPG